MPLLLSSAPGAVARIASVPGEVAVSGGLSVVLNDKDRAIDTMNLLSCLITRLIVIERTNHQIMHTMGNHIYTYIFGDRMGDLQVTGICTSGDCFGKTNSDLPEPDKQHGINKLRTWYHNNKMSKRREPVSLTVGDQVFRGYIYELRLDTLDVRTSLIQFVLGLYLIPEM